MDKSSSDICHLWGLGVEDSASEILFLTCKIKTTVDTLHRAQAGVKYHVSSIHVGNTSFPDTEDLKVYLPNWQLCQKGKFSGATPGPPNQHLWGRDPAI